MRVKLKVLVALSALAGVFAGLVVPAQAGEWKTVRFGLEATYPPYEFKTANGELQGFDVDLGNALCVALKARCVWVENEFDGLIPALQAKKFDAINSALSITEKRKTQMDFTDPLYLVPNRLVAKTGQSLLPTPAGLKGRRIGVLGGSIHEEYAKHYWAGHEVEVVSYQDQEQIYADLIAGRLDATFVDAVSADNAFIKQSRGKGFAFAGPAVKDPILGIGRGIGVRKQDKDLTEALNLALKRLKADGTYDRLTKKYFGDVDVSIH
jgi:lysine/arginine/ornithine transport system substrate-binding protein